VDFQKTEELTVQACDIGNADVYRKIFNIQSPENKWVPNLNVFKYDVHSTIFRFYDEKFSTVKKSLLN
jgi:hypothetical protein